MSPWLAGALRWADRVEAVSGVLLAGGVAEPDPAVEDLIDLVLPEGARLLADPAVARLNALRAAVVAVRGSTGEARRAAGHACWEEVHGLLAWVLRYRRELQHAALRATLTRADAPAERQGIDADLVIVGVLPAGRRWFAHGRFLVGGGPVVLVDEVRGDGDGWNSPVISALFQAKLVPAQWWGRVLRLPAGHPTERSAGRVIARPAFDSRPQVVAGALRPSLEGDRDRGRLRAVREGDDVVATLDRKPLAMGEMARWNLWKAAGFAGFDGWGWTANGVLIGVETELGPAFVAADPRALPAPDWPVGDVPEDLGERVAAAVGGAFGAAWRDPTTAWDPWFAAVTRDADVASAAGRLLCLRARGERGVDEARAAALGWVARGEVDPLALLALDLASPGALAEVPAERLRKMAMSAPEEGRLAIGWVFARAARAGELTG